MTTTMEREILEHVNITIGSQKDLKRAINFVNNNNLFGYMGFYKVLTIKCNVKLKNKMYLVNYNFKHHTYYTRFKKVLREKYG